MSALFGNTLGFTPAFTGQQLAIAAGGGTANALTSGMNAGTGQDRTKLAKEQFAFEKKNYEDTIKRVDAMMNYLDGGRRQAMMTSMDETLRSGIDFGRSFF